MAVDDYLPALRRELPELFGEDYPFPDLEGEWFRGRVEKAGAEEALIDFLAEELQGWDFPDRPPTPPPDLVGDRPRFPGGPISKPGPAGAIERLAFYCPYHFFGQDEWGIYMLLEGWLTMAAQIRRHDPSVGLRPAILAAREKLYRHELFHHKTEVFATRLEVAVRLPMYRTGVRDLYDRTFGSRDCEEEALANGYALREMRKPDWRYSYDAVRRFVENAPPGYDRGVDYVAKNEWRAGEREFSETLLRESHGGVRRTDPEVWMAFSHAFTGRIRSTSEVIYLLPRGSPLSGRIPFKRLGW